MRTLDAPRHSSRFQDKYKVVDEFKEGTSLQKIILVFKDNATEELPGSIECIVVWSLAGTRKWTVWVCLRQTYHHDKLPRTNVSISQKWGTSIPSSSPKEHAYRVQIRQGVTGEDKQSITRPSVPDHPSGWSGHSVRHGRNLRQWVQRRNICSLKKSAMTR